MKSINLNKEMKLLRPYTAVSQAQKIMIEVLGQKNQVWGFGGNPIMINRKLSSGHKVLGRNPDPRTSMMFGRNIY